MPRTRREIGPDQGWVEQSNPTTAQRLRSHGSRGVRFFTSGECRVIVSRDPVGPGGALLWHLSISCEDRYPTWDEIADARYRLLADELTFAMYLPPRAEYVNRHPNCFHLTEIIAP